jgi:hypothetical protein
LFIGLESAGNSGGSGINAASLRDSVERLTAAVSQGTKLIESAVSTIISSAGLHGVSDGAAIEVLESVLDVAVPQIPWQALHHFFSSVLDGSAFNQKAPPKPTVVDQVMQLDQAGSTTGAAADSINADMADELFADDSADWSGSNAAADQLMEQEQFAGNPVGGTDRKLIALDRPFELAVDDAANESRSMRETSSSSPAPNSPRAQLLKSARAIPPDCVEQSDDEAAPRDSIIAQWLVPGAIAAVVVSGSSLGGDRERSQRHPKLVKRPDRRSVSKLNQ